MSASFLAAMETRAEDLYDLRCELGNAQCEECNTWYPQLDMNYDDDTGFHTCNECYECTDDNRCEDCTHCARTRVCPDCECVGGCYDDCINLAYKCCRDCDYSWDTKAEWEAGKGRVAFSYPAEDIEDGDVVCSLCYKGVHEYYPTDDEEESDEE